MRHNRHTAALALLRSGNDISIVKAWLGHASVETTHTYVVIDIEMKRKALDASKPSQLNASPKKRRKWLKPDILQWLEQLSQKARIMWSATTHSGTIDPQQRGMAP